MAEPAIDETDFGDISGTPAASGDQTLWGDTPMEASAGAGADMWGGGGGANGSEPEGDHPGGGMEMVRTAAELANLEKFSGGDDSPSGLELDAEAPKAAPRKGDENLVSQDPSAVLNAMPPEKLEALVREVVRQAIQPIIEKIAWEVVPDLAEDIIKDEIKRLTN